jgi:hypothetical protein
VYNLLVKQLTIVTQQSQQYALEFKLSSMMGDDLQVAADKSVTTDKQVPSKWQPFYLLNSLGVSETQSLTSLTFSDIFSGEISCALISNFMIDIPYILQKCPRLFETDCEVCIVHGSKMHEEMLKFLATIEAYNVTLTRANLESELFGTHHCKYAVLFYAQGVRVVITTANFIEKDLEHMTQGVYVQDFPLHSTSSLVSSTSFGDDLRSFLCHLKVHEVHGKKFVDSVVARLNLYDFSNAHVCLVASIPGYFMHILFS